MNNNLLQKAYALNKCILEEPVVVEYKKYKQIIQSHPEYLQQEENLKNLQKKIIHHIDSGLDTSELENEYHTLMNQFLSNPVINNYMVLKEEVNNLLMTVNHTINQYLQDE